MPGLENEEDGALRREVARRIVESRVAAGMSQRELAAMVGMAPSTIGNYEQGTRLPGPKEATLLGNALGVSPAYLLLVEGNDMLLLDAEAEMVRALRTLPPEEQQRFLKLLEVRAKAIAQPALTKKVLPPTR